MKLLFLITLLCTLSIGSIAQICNYYGKNSEASSLCDFLGGNQDSYDINANSAVDKILNSIGASKRFVLYSCGQIENCAAISYKGIRYIIYDPVFLNDIAKNTNSWSKLSILAHEIGHHVNGHPIDILFIGNETVALPSLEEKRKMELEADEFSGFVLQKLGATLEQAQMAISLISDSHDDSNSTHPSREKRLHAIKVGFEKARSGSVITQNSNRIENLFYSGSDKMNQKDYYGAIINFTDAIKIDPTISSAHNHRGICKAKINDDSGAILDYTAEIKINPRLYYAYFNRGLSKIKLKDYEGAISDFLEVLKLNDTIHGAYYNIAIAKKDLAYTYTDPEKQYQSMKEAISFISKAIELDKESPHLYFERGSYYLLIQIYSEADLDFSKCIELSPSTFESYYQKAMALNSLGKYDDAIGTLTKALKINPNSYQCYHLRGFIHLLKNELEASIKDFTDALRLNPQYVASLTFRAEAKKQLGLKFCDDYKQACELGSNEYCLKYSQECK